MNTGHDRGDDGTAGSPEPAPTRRPYPPGIAFLMEERPLLWYEKPEEYDELQRSFLRDLAPVDAVACVMAKNFIDVVWELRRARRLTHAAINYAMPAVAARMLVPDRPGAEAGARARIERQALSAARRDGDAIAAVGLSERKRAMGVTPEAIHYQTHAEALENLTLLRRECERLESRMQRLLKDFEARRASMAAMARTLIAREQAQTVAFREVH